MFKRSVFLSLSVLGQVVLCCDPLNKVLRKSGTCESAHLSQPALICAHVMTRAAASADWVPGRGTALPVPPMIGCFLRSRSREVEG